MTQQTPNNEDDAKTRAQSDEDLTRKQDAAYTIDGDETDSKPDPLGQEFDKKANPSKNQYSEANYERLSNRLSGRKAKGPKLHESVPGVQVKLGRTITGSQVVHVKDIDGPIRLNSARVSFALPADPATAAQKTHISAAIAAQNFKETAVVIQGHDDFSKIMLLLGGKHHGMNIKNEKEILALREANPSAWEKAQEAWSVALTGNAPKASSPETTAENLSKVAGEAALAIGLLTPQQKTRNEDMQHKLAAISIRQALKNGDTGITGEEEKKKSKTGQYMSALTGQFRGKSATEIEAIVNQSLKENKIVPRHIKEAREFVEIGTNKLPIGVTPIAMLMLDMGFLSRDAKENLMAAQGAVRTLEAIRNERAGNALSLPKDPNGVVMSYDRVHGTAGKFAGKEAAVTTEAQLNYKNTYDLINRHQMNGVALSADEKTTYSAALRKHEADALIQLQTVKENLKNMGARNAGQIDQDIQGLIDSFRTPAGATAAPKAQAGPKL